MFKVQIIKYTLSIAIVCISSLLYGQSYDELKHQLGDWKALVETKEGYIKYLEKEKIKLEQEIERLKNGSVSTSTTTTPSGNNGNSTGRITSIGNSLKGHHDIGRIRRDIEGYIRNQDYYGGSIDFGEYSFDYFVFDTRSQNYKIDFFWKDEATRGRPQYRTIKNLKETLNRKSVKLIFATNGGMFNKDFAPQGLLIQEGLVKKILDVKENRPGNFYMQPNGVFMIDDKDRVNILTTEVMAKTFPSLLNRNGIEDRVYYATQSGPMLVTRGIINDNFNEGSRNKLLRSGVGILDNNRVVFVISKGDMNFFDFATIFKDIFSCENALFLDGQVSQMYSDVPKLKRNGIYGEYGTIIGIRNK